MSGLLKQFSDMTNGACRVMVIDSSALISILLGEPEAIAFAKVIASNPKKKMEMEHHRYVKGSPTIRSS